MTLRACPREKEVRELVLRGQWTVPVADPGDGPGVALEAGLRAGLTADLGASPGVVHNELQAHVASCRACGDLVLVMTAFRSARAESTAAANPGSAGVVWWRAQLRKRQTAMEQIARPVLGAQIFAWSVTLAIAVVFAVTQARNGLRWLDWLRSLRQLPQSNSFHFEELWLSANSMPLWGLLTAVLGLAAVAILSGVILYLDRQRQ